MKRWNSAGAGTLALLLLAGLAAPAQPQRAQPAYEVYAISYGVIADFPVSALIAGADPARRMDIQMMVWLLKGSGGRNILVDSGFYRQKFLDRWKPKNFVKPSEAIARLGLKPDEITDVIITHAHWDHAGGADLFPKARIWIQKDEYDYYRDPAHLARSGVDAEDIAALEQAEREGRVHLVAGDADALIPGVRFFLGGRHTYASQFVGVETRTGTVVLASDNVYLYENLEKHIPIAQTSDAQANLAAQDRMRQIASRPELIVPGHDPEVFVRFPRLGNGVARIAGPAN